MPQSASHGQDEHASICTAVRTSDVRLHWGEKKVRVYQSQGISKHASTAPHNLQVQSYFPPHAWTSTQKSLRRSGDTRTHMTLITPCQQAKVYGEFPPPFFFPLFRPLLARDSPLEFPHPSLCFSRTSPSSADQIVACTTMACTPALLMFAFEFRHSAQAELICAAWGA